MTGEEGNGRTRWSAGRARRGVPRRITVVCLPDAGGPVLAEALRRAMAGAAAVRLRLVVTAPVADTVPVLIGDPLSGVFWPFAYSARDDEAALDDAARRARRLWWLGWEMGIDAEVELVQGSALAVVRAEAAADRSDAVVLAASGARRWQASVRDARGEARRAGLDLQVALDTPVRPARRLVPTGR